jgi:uncharacterized protein (DUF433 family)
METSHAIIGAFSEEHAERLTGVSRNQLRKWDRIGLLRPAYAADERSLPYGRVYSFRDLVSLRVLNQLRNEMKVPQTHLIEVHKDLSRLSDEPWASSRLQVVGRRVVLVEPGSRRKRMAAGSQMVLDIPLREVIGNLRDAIARLNERTLDQQGKVVREKFVAQNQPIIAGTRIPVAAIRSFAKAGYDVSAIIREYPSLTPADVKAAIEYEGESAAA